MKINALDSLSNPHKLASVLKSVRCITREGMAWRYGVFRYLLVPKVHSSGRPSIEELGNPAVNVGGLMNGHKGVRPCNRFDGKLGLDTENLRRRCSFLICRVVLGMIGDHEEVDGVPA